MSSVLQNLQAAVVQRLTQKLELPGAAVAARRAADLESQVDAAVKGALGLSLLVLDPAPSRVASSLPGPVFLEVAVTVRVIENLLINTSGSGLLAAAERASKLLHLWPLPSFCGDGVLQLAEAEPWAAPGPAQRGAVALD